jgi:replicative DNA helicase
MVIVDYLHKIAYPETVRGGWNEASYIGANVEALKNCAERLEIPLILGAQVNRDYKGRARPTFADLKGSSDIEQKVNQIVVLHRPYDRPEGDQFGQLEELHAYVDKNTSGGTGKAVIWHRMGRYRLECQEQGESGPPEPRGNGNGHHAYSWETKAVPF